MTSNIFEINYNGTGASQSNNALGMREMQERVYAKRSSQHLLIKAPPASGKSRALMFIALDKLHAQGLKKAIIAVPERSIGKSFRSTKLTDYGFYWDWEVFPKNNLTEQGTSKSKVKQFVDFMHSESPDDRVLICTHATLRFAFEQLADSDFNDVLLAIDEFHHVSQDDNSVLGNALRNILANSTAHVVAMTGSYFRGDSVPILAPEDEQKFDKVSYTYYEQLEGYKYLKSFAMGYNFYRGRYTDVLHEVLDTSKKTIIHIPNVNSGESTKDKYDEVDRILDELGQTVPDPKTGLWLVTEETGRVLKVADLVTEEGREKVQDYLNKMTSLDDLDIIIALGMAKEGFDWPYAEYALTIGYRQSLTEIVQIIGRVTRDSSNKSHAQFTNLISQPDAQDDEVFFAVNNVMKAITASLLMESVLAPNFKFKRKDREDQKSSGAEMFVKGLKEPSTQRTKDIIENDLNDLRASILQEPRIQSAIAARTDAEVINKQMIPAIIKQIYPDLSGAEVEEVRQQFISQSVVQSAERKEGVGQTDFLKMADKFVNIDDLSIDLIDQINPFQRAYEVISREIDAPTLRLIQDYMDGQKMEFSEEELLILYPQIKQFLKENGRHPDKLSNDKYEQRLAYALLQLSQMKLKMESGND
ncbi:DEAD/DEAH box helicase family protein [Streptococcus pneumoniae]|uniref:DNA helicase n=1 Tax=Streptococcus pneumoniae TaxID=1313 RepID=A0AA95D9F5_STREE|nr:DEAD/DEAH box helicase family protein [Streptococcus pneumoniae]MDS2295407.1 DEAD/DEAH box helicase family protein [Streptococcus pneumoniae]MDS2575271.1 DEAD/DEAH box helicase family protein [Streptococcus pneumoniae]MDS2653843.1 DEAD/DEAH box helicase family protein [Streptococcus pneumoniae]MDS2763993.1 DEAD/DEAH box helicase family protein [Streptococcus pneumoniae]MDS3490452.1 DEAD/DEAH box helicase family protein [Streptococcus pneumoniae]